MAFNEKKKQRSLFSVLLTVFLDNFGLAIVYPIFTPLLLKDSFLSVETPFLERTIILGLLIGAFPLAQFFGAPLIGQFSDRCGRKKAFYITILGTALGYTFTSISIMEHSLLWLFLSRFCTGLFAGNLTLCLAAIADMSPDDLSRTKNFGLIGAIGGLSFVIAIAFGGIFSNPGISQHFNPSTPFWVTAFLSYINFICMLRFFHETHPGTRHPGFNPFRGFHNIGLGLKNKDLRAIYVINFLFMLAWIETVQFLPTLLLVHFKIPVENMTIYLVGIGAFWSLSNLLFNRRLAKHFFPGQTLLISLIALSLLYLCTLFTNTPFMFFLFFFPAVCFASLCWTNGIAAVSLKAPSAIQGSILGINQSMTSLSALLSPILGGILVATSDHAIYVFGAIITMIGVGLIVRHKVYEHVS